MGAQQAGQEPLPSELHADLALDAPAAPEG